MIAPYASGAIEFSVTYKKLSGILHECYQRPDKAIVQGGMDGGWLTDRSFSAPPLFELTLASLSPFALWAEKTVYNVRLSAVAYLDYNGTFEETEEYLFASRMDDGEYWKISADIPDVIPNLLLSWQLPDGTIQRYLISMSGMDGSLLLIDPNSIAMAQPGELQPNNDVFNLAWDLNGDGATDFLSVSSSDNIWSISVIGNEVEYTQPTLFSKRPRCYVADADGDGCFEIFLSGPTSRDAQSTYVWRFQETLDKVLFTLDGEELEYLPCSVLGVDTDEAVLTGTVEILGQYTGTRPFSDGPNGTLSPAYGSRWDLRGNQKYIRTSADLVFSLPEGGSSRLISGTSLRIISFDGESVSFETEDGVKGSFSVTHSENGVLLVGGKSISLCFDEIDP